MSGKLYIVATPIGNLEDMTLRAVRILKEVDIIACEEPHVTRKLLGRFEIHKPLIAYHQHSGSGATKRILSLLREGKSLAFVTSAGTPGVSDPGPRLVRDAIEELGENVQIVPIPGVSAVTAMASLAGVSMDAFHFFGYPPAKKGRAKFFSLVAAMHAPGILFESPHRILRTVADLEHALGPDRNLVVGRELTKAFETFYRGTTGEVRKRLEGEKPRGEYALVVLPEEKKPRRA